jgi:hypothetical protein
MVRPEPDAKLTIDHHAARVRHHSDGMANLVAALRADPELMQQSRERLRHYRDLEKVRGELSRFCWISHTTNQTLKAAMAQAEAQQPGDPGKGGQSV